MNFDTLHLSTQLLVHKKLLQNIKSTSYIGGLVFKKIILNFFKLILTCPQNHKFIPTCFFKYFQMMWIIVFDI